MAHFAQVIDNKVIQVLVVEQEFINTGLLGDPLQWIQTSYNTRGGIHFDPTTGEPSADQSKALRKNFAGIGYAYDQELDAFIPPKPFPSWVLNQETCCWDPPIPYPEGYFGWDRWDEENQVWILCPEPPIG